MAGGLIYIVAIGWRELDAPPKAGHDELCERVVAGQLWDEPGHDGVILGMTIRKSL
jgi:hypothetical protein